MTDNRPEDAPMTCEMGTCLQSEDGANCAGCRHLVPAQPPVPAQLLCRWRPAPDAPATEKAAWAASMGRAFFDFVWVRPKVLIKLLSCPPGMHEILGCTGTSCEDCHAHTE